MIARLQDAPGIGGPPWLTWDTRCALRVMKGRSPFVRLYQQYDAGKGHALPVSIHYDPILALCVARHWCRKGPEHAMRYGAIRQDVVCPVLLP